MYCTATSDLTPLLHSRTTLITHDMSGQIETLLHQLTFKLPPQHLQWPVRPRTFLLPVFISVVFSLVLEELRNVNVKALNWRRDGPGRAKWQIMKGTTSKSIVGNYQHTDTHTPAHTHKYFERQGMDFDGGVTLRCLIHECFPPFSSPTWKQEFCPEKKQNGWTRQYSDNTRLPVQLPCARMHWEAAPQRGHLLFHLHLLRLLCGVSWLDWYFLCSSSRRKPSKRLFRRWNSCFPQTQPGNERTEELGVHFVNSRSDDGWVDVS